MKLDKEQKKMLKAIWPAMIVFPLGYPLIWLITGKLDSWKEIILYVVGGLIVAAILAVFYLLGSKIPKKDE
ncbi:MAG: hypothetical protein IKX71_05400 [Bacteroidales bacterium]|nr:hypothetical protein [Bacteroidales bacterium]